MADDNQRRLFVIGRGVVFIRRRDNRRHAPSIRPPSNSIACGREIYLSSNAASLLLRITVVLLSARSCRISDIGIVGEPAVNGHMPRRNMQRFL